MSIFRRDSSAPPVVSDRPLSADPPHESSRSGTHVARGTRIEGTVSGATPLSVDGELHGEVRVDATVTIGTDGSIEGPVRARRLRVAGRQLGDVTADERVEIAATGSLEGNVATPSFITAEGAFFKGRVEMREAAPSEAPFKNRDARRTKAAGDPQTPKGR
jgi:cytoskeletal protein CcmA (bactofilin family)